MELEKSHIRKIILATLTSLCSNTLKFKSQLSIEGLFGITIDKDQVLLININEEVSKDSSATINKTKIDINQSTSNSSLPFENLPNNSSVDDDNIAVTNKINKNNKEDSSGNLDSESAEPYSEVLKTVKLVQKADGMVEQLSQVAWKKVDAGGQVVHHKTYETVKTLNSNDAMEENFEEDLGASGEVFEEQANYDNEAEYGDDNQYVEDNTEYAYQTYEQNAADEDYAMYDDYAGTENIEFEKNFKAPQPRKPKSKWNFNNGEKEAPKRKKKKQDLEYSDEGEWGHAVNNQHRNPTKKIKVEVADVYHRNQLGSPRKNPMPHSNISSPNNFFQRTPNPQWQNSSRQNTSKQNTPGQNPPCLNILSQQPRANLSSQKFPWVRLPSQGKQNFSVPSKNAQRISTMLEMAIQLIMDKKLTIAKACTLYSLPKQLLLKRLKETQM